MKLHQKYKPKGRASKHCLYTRLGCCRSAAFLLLSLILAPAFLTECSIRNDIYDSAVHDEQEQAGRASAGQIYIEFPKNQTVRTLDVFIFDDDSLGKLDSYRHFDSPVSFRFKGASGNGAKIAAVTANVPAEKFCWDNVSSLQALRSLTMLLEEESIQSPVMSGICRMQAGYTGGADINLSTLGSRISLRSIRCDFSGMPYEGQRLEDVKAYLVNASGSVPVIPDTEYVPGVWLDRGRAVTADTAGMKGILYGEIPGSIGPETLAPGLEFYCYPNEMETESFGMPFTRLVIEGKLMGRTCYYPININRAGFGFAGGIQGLSRNTAYYIDLSIFRAGTDDPDAPAEAGMAAVTGNVLPWFENDADFVEF